MTLTAFGQAGLQDILYTAATTTQDGGGRPWAYLVWDATTPALVNGRQYAIYLKAGDAASPALYQKVALVQRQTDPRVISSLLQRAVNLGEDLNELNDGISKMFQTMSNALALPLPEKISAIIRGSAGHPAFEANLRLLAKTHPGLALSLGLGHAELIAGPDGMKTTFEVREYDPVKARELGVVGRVTVAAGQPVVLPAPGAPVLMPENNPKGHLNAKFRWATSPELRRLSLLQHGFNLWRMTKTFAETRGYGTAPPFPTHLPSLAQQFPNEVRQVNRLPVLPAKSFDAVSVRDFTHDSTTLYLTDDNGRFDGGAPFNNGDRYYYFVTARDLLGRDGWVSPGEPVTLCNRLPPTSPKGLRVENDYTYTNGAGHQCFKLSWRPNINSPEDHATAYYLYRWNSQTQMLAFDAAQNYLANVIAGPIPHLGGVTQLCVLDNGANAPAISATSDQPDDDQTFWYTVRAVETNACGTNFSPNSAFVYGVLRDRVGPAAPTGYVELNCPSPTIAFGDFIWVPETGRDPQRAYFRARATRTNPYLLWAEFTVRVRKTGLVQQNPPVIGPVEETRELGRVEFNGENLAVADFDLPRTGLISVTFEARAVLGDGKVSATATSWSSEPAAHEFRLLGEFRADVAFTRATISTPTPARITGITLSAGNLVTLFFTPRSASRYRVLASSDLVRWAAVPTNGMIHFAGSVRFQDPARPTAPHRFYRLAPDDYSAPAPCAHLTMVDPVGGTNMGVKTVIDLPPDSKEFRLYRRVDDGPMTLVAQGRGDAEQTRAVTNLDQSLPAGSVTMCYYAQVLDRHGNPSPMTQLGGCFIAIQSPPPCPVVSAVETAGSVGDPKALVRWFCPTAGVDRFEIRLAPRTPPATTTGGGTGGGGGGSRFSATRATSGGVLPVVFATNITTERIGGALGNGPKFSVGIPVAAGEKYTIEVVALNKAGMPSAGCRKARTFEWTGPAPEAVTPQVPWPARGLPPVASWPGVQAKLMERTNEASGYDPSYPVGIHIGTLATVFVATNAINCMFVPRLAGVASGNFAPAILPPQANALPSLANPLQHLFPTEAALKEKLFPVVLYRTQLANVDFPFVSGDIIQASPLMEKIAYRLEPVGAPAFVVVRDPFVRVVRSRTHTEPAVFLVRQYHPPGSNWLCDLYRNTTASQDELYLLDTQPVLAGATYRYFMVRFDPVTKEPAQVIDAGVVSIPAN